MVLELTPRSDTRGQCLLDQAMFCQELDSRQGAAHQLNYVQSIIRLNYLCNFTDTYKSLLPEQVQRHCLPLGIWIA